MSILDELLAARARAANKYQLSKHQEQPTVKEEKREQEKVSKNNDSYWSFFRQETTSSVIECAHPQHGRCLQCSGRMLLHTKLEKCFKLRDMLSQNMYLSKCETKDISTMHEYVSHCCGLYHYCFESSQSQEFEANKKKVNELIDITRKADPKSLQITNQPKSSLQYGEVLFYSCAHMVFDLLMLSSSKLFSEHMTFIDLGSGIGKSLLAVSLLFPNFRKCIGIEIVRKLHEIACNSTKVWSDSLKLQDILASKVELINGNFFDETLIISKLFGSDHQTTVSTVVFIASTAFSASTMTKLNDMLLQLLDDNFQCINYVGVITLSHPLPDKQRFKILKTDSYRMSWGNVSVFFQQYQPQLLK
ncbi:hypothetical protein RFI_29968 [Reticulomyxa filosa]|uniref:Histone-lysine N-methyltransferase, H3 lysine-79 specific n=1 Tax=Reticulomyxa filosa TaxID=46433 RepID=X6M331_RETFI|nr:hypothetical protein RFI_29968 [Reticulomyxa filosa]|eukprot:ETO07420.1 hypothetical protein RFI_29968 [Reticulomyxa filosa]